MSDDPEINYRKKVLVKFLTGQYSTSYYDEDEIREMYRNKKIKFSYMSYGVAPVYVLENDEEYIVATDDEADDAAYEFVESLLDDIGLTGFNVDAVDFVEDDWFEEAAEEGFQFYVDDMDYNEKVKMKDDYGLEEEEDDYELVLALMDDVRKNYSGRAPFAQHYLDEFGEEDFNSIVVENNLVDPRILAEHVVNTDGRGHILSSYDGEEGEQKYNNKWYYIYRIN